MATILYEYSTPCLGGSISDNKLYISFPYWGIQCLDTVGGIVLKTWTKPSSQDIFITPVVSIADNNILLSSILHSNERLSNLLLWSTKDMSIIKAKHEIVFESSSNSKTTSLTSTSTSTSSSSYNCIIRMFHFQNARIPYIILIMSQGDIILYHYVTKVFITCGNIWSKDNDKLSSQSLVEMENDTDNIANIIWSAKFREREIDSSTDNQELNNNNNDNNSKDMVYAYLSIVYSTVGKENDDENDVDEEYEFSEEDEEDEEEEEEDEENEDDRKEVVESYALPSKEMKLCIIPLQQSSKRSIPTMGEITTVLLTSGEKNMDKNENENENENESENENKNKKNKKKKDNSSNATKILDYDLFDSNTLVVLWKDSTLHGYDIITTDQQKEKNSIHHNIGYLEEQWCIECEDLDISQCRDLCDIVQQKINVKFCTHHTCLLQTTRIMLLEKNQCIVVGNSKQEYNVLKLWCYPCRDVLRNKTGKQKISAWEVRNLYHTDNDRINSLWLAPLITRIYNDQSDTNNKKSKKAFDIFVITSEKIISVRLPSLNNNMLDWLLSTTATSAILSSNMSYDENNNYAHNKTSGKKKNDQLQANQIHHWQWLRDKNWNALESMNWNQIPSGDQFLQQFIESILEDKKWSVLTNILNRYVNWSETDIVFILSHLMSILKKSPKNSNSFFRLFNKVLQMEMNDLFMRRIIQLLPAQKVQMLIEYLIHLMKIQEFDTYKTKANVSNEEAAQMSMEIILTWLTIILDAHLYQLSFTEEPSVLSKQLRLLKRLLRRYDDKITKMVKLQAHIHQMLNDISANNESARGENNKKSANNENQINKNKDYFVEHISL